MAPAPVARAISGDDALELFVKIGLDQRTAKNAVANAKVTANLVDSIDEAGLRGGCDKSVGNLVYTTATKFPANALVHRKTLLEYVVTGKVKSQPQLDAAFLYFAGVGTDPFDAPSFEKACGVGVVVSPEEIAKVVADVIELEKERILAERYRVNVGLLLTQVRQVLPWVDGKLSKAEMDSQMTALLGERTAADDEKPTKKKDKKKPKEEMKPESAAVAEETSALVAESADPYSIFPKPEDNFNVHTEVFFSDGTIMRPANTKEMLQKHLAATGGKIFTRFPPEPNGYLHIGHAKAMNIDFGLAKEYGGECYLRYDDTNPEAEKQEYIDHIQEIVSWLGWKPYKVTFSSDYFQELYDLAVKLIKSGHAYVDHQTPDEIKEYREKQLESPWRNRPIEESLKLFEDMRAGLLAEGSATLRMKQDVKNENPNMWDLIAYRIKFVPHPHAGDKWCIYPSYDYTHCIVDSLENITHSLCTLEFEVRRASYYWLLEVLGLYLPYVWEYSRLNITHTVMSKRKLNRLVTENYVDGWDDPRLMTLSGLRRRGATPDAINAFCRAIGITRSDNLIRVELLEHFMRDNLNKICPRTMAVLRPLKLVITNFPEGEVELLDADVRPDIKDDVQKYKVPFSRVVYIESTDFRLQDIKNYYGLAPGKTVMLRYAYPVTCKSVVLEDDGCTVKEVLVEYDRAKSSKPKGVIHWVGAPAEGVSPLTVEIRLFDKLFKSENPSESPDWLSDMNPKSKEVIPAAFAVPSLASAKVGDLFQFERLGYFCIDKDSTPERIIFNRTVTLKESSSKYSVEG